MKIGYFCYFLSGTGPRTRAADVINAVADRTDHEVTVLTNQPEKVTAAADVSHVSLQNPVATLLKTRQRFANADVVHVPINVYQVLFVRLAYRGPLVAGIGPGIQGGIHKHLGRLLGIDVKIKSRESDMEWEQAGYNTAISTATIDRRQFYPYDDKWIKELRASRGYQEDDTVVLYVGKLSEKQGAHIFSRMAKLAAADDNMHFIVAGSGPLENQFMHRDDLTFEGFVDNKDTPDLYNLADVTAAPRERDITSNVGLESIACGTPVITTAEGPIVDLFQDRGTYVWADRTPEAVLETVRELIADPEYYERQRQRGLDTIEEMELTLESALETHIEVYADLAEV